MLLFPARLSGIVVTLVFSIVGFSFAGERRLRFRDGYSSTVDSQCADQERTKLNTIDLLEHGVLVAHLVAQVHRYPGTLRLILRNHQWV